MGCDWILSIPIVVCLVILGCSEHLIKKHYFDNNEQLLYELKYLGQRLLPFFIKAVIFFSNTATVGSNPIIFAVLKCLPTLALILFLLEPEHMMTENNLYTRKIIIGLFFSVLGDAFLVGESRLNFEIGLLMFALAHLSYIFAFGWSRCRPIIGCAFAVIGICVVMFLMKSEDLDGSNIMTYCVAFYICLICTMAWRAASRIESTKKFNTICGVVGAIFFVISDFTLAINQFFGTIYLGHVIVMITYYVAQLGIALSAVSIKL